MPSTVATTSPTAATSLLRRVGAALSRAVPRIRTAPSLPPVRAGVIGAATSVAGSYARGLLPRSASDQAIATGVVASTHGLLTAASAAAIETVALYSSGSHGVHDRRPPANAMLTTSLAFLTTGLVVERALPPHPDEPMQRSLARFAGHFLTTGGSATIMVTATDEVLGHFPRTSGWRNRSLLVDLTLASGLAALGVYQRRRRAQRYGLVDPDRPAFEVASAKGTVRAVGVGVASGLGLLAVAGTEQFIARRVSRTMSKHIGSVEIGSPWLGHAVAVSLLGGAGVVGLSRIKRRVEHGGDVVEAAYPEAPTSEYVTAGPRSLIDFADIGKEGRRFVLMALTPEEITSVMGTETAEPPIRIVAGYEAADTAEARAELCLAEMEALGAFDRKVICVASPTGVGYVSYVFAETLEYLTGGDCAIVMPQYALVPSALALTDTRDGAELQRRVLAGIAERVAAMPAADRPTVVQFGESLGAQVALDIAFPDGSTEFDELGLAGGLYLGVPFRTHTWNAWIADEQGFDPSESMVAVSEPSALAELAPERVERARHLMVVHHDDPVNKFGYRQVVRPPWWMGRPDTRPPKVPREVLWRPISTFVLTLIDLKNGMHFAPGTFVRRGHDYRIDTVAATAAAFRLQPTERQQQAVEVALRKREVEWARRRLIARKFAAARDAINTNLKKWGVSVTTLDSLPEGDPEHWLESSPAVTEPVDFVVADHDPAAAPVSA